MRRGWHYAVRQQPLSNKQCRRYTPRVYMKRADLFDIAVVDEIIRALNIAGVYRHTYASGERKYAFRCRAKAICYTLESFKSGIRRVTPIF